MTIIVNGPGGETVNFPDGTPHDTINKVMQQNFSAKGGGAAPEGESTLGGALKATGVGLGQGVLGLAGMGGDIAELGTQGINALTGSNLQNKVPLPTSAGLQKMVEHFTGPFYKPKGTAENVLNTAASFAPAMLGGPESLLTKAATRVALPTIGSELAGAATEGTGAEPYAKAAGAIGGAVLGHKIMAPRPPNLEMATQIPIQAAKLGFESPEMKAVEYKPQVVEQLSNNIQGQLRRSSNDTLAPKTFKTVENMKTPVGPEVSEAGPLGEVVTPTAKTGARGSVSAAEALAEAGPAHAFEDLHTTRQKLGTIAGETVDGKATPDAAAATKAIKLLDQYIENTPQSHLAKGNAKELAATFKTAKADYAAGMSAQRIMQKTIETPELQAAAANSGRNVGNITRQKQRQILTSAKGTRGLTDEEQAMLEQGVRGTFRQNHLREAGHYLGGGGGLGGLITAGAGYLATGSPLGLAAPLAGRAMQSAANRLATKQAEKVVRQILTRSPAYQKYLATLPPQDRMALARGILATGALGVRPQGLLSPP